MRLWHKRISQKESYGQIILELNDFSSASVILDGLWFSQVIVKQVLEDIKQKTKSIWMFQEYLGIILNATVQRQWHILSLSNNL